MYKERHSAESCVKCNAGMGTGNTIGAKHEKECSYKICPAGMQHTQHSTQNCKWYEGSCCTECPEDTHKATEGSALCIPCGDEFTTESQTGSVSCTPICSAGQYGDIGDTECKDCPLNTYKQNRSSLPCEVCNHGYDTTGMI